MFAVQSRSLICSKLSWAGWAGGGVALAAARQEVMCFIAGPTLSWNLSRAPFQYLPRSVASLAVFVAIFATIFVLPHHTLVSKMEGFVMLFVGCGFGQDVSTDSSPSLLLWMTVESLGLEGVTS